MNGEKGFNEALMYYNIKKGEKIWRKMQKQMLHLIRLITIMIRPEMALFRRGDLMKVKFNSNLLILLMVIVLVFSFNTKSHAKEAGDSGERVATFFLTTDIGLIPFAATHNYHFYVEYTNNTDKIYITEHAMCSYYRNWSGWALTSLSNPTVNRITYYKSDNSYAGTSGYLDNPYSLYLPGDSEGISAKIGYSNLTILSKTGTAKTTFSLHCPEAAYPVSYKDATANLK